MNMSMGGSKPHACMQHATLTRTHGRTQHSRTHAAHITRNRKKKPVPFRIDRDTVQLFER